MSSNPTPSPRRTQMFVSPEADPSTATQILTAPSHVQLIPFAGAEIRVEIVAAALRAAGHHVSITRPLPDGVDCSSVATLPRV
jgi:hypothetical protein